VNHATDERLRAWREKAGYRRDPFAALHAEEDEHLETHFTSHAGHFEEYAGPPSTVIAGARGSGKTANCLKLAETLRNARGISNFVLVYDARAPWQATDAPRVPGLKHHLREIIRRGIRQLLDAAADSLSRKAERQLRQVETWCQEFHPHANYLKRLDALRQMALDAGYGALYLLIDEQQSSEREPVRAAELLSPLLDGNLFDLDRLYLKLFVPSELVQDIEELCQAVDERVQVAYLQWSESDLAELLRALLREAWGSRSYPLRAEELGRLAPLMPDIDRALIHQVATNAPTPRGLMRLGQILFAQSARRWTPGQAVSITPDGWAAALREWHQFLAAEKLVDRPVTLVALKILFTGCKATRAEAHVIEPSTVGHTLLLPYKRDDLWTVLWALERFALYGRQLPPDTPHVKTLRRLGLIQETVSQPTLVNDLLERVGDRMYRYLFVKSGLGRLLGERETKANRLREERVKDVRLWLELRFAQEAADLARFPWELLRRDEVFLLQTGRFELTRYHCVNEPEPPLRLNRPFGLLYIAPRVDAGNLSRDRPRIEEAFQSSDLLQLREVNPPSFERLMQEAHGSSHQAFHYDDHGTFRRRCSECQRVFPPWQDTCPYGHPLPPPQGYLQFDDGRGHGDPRPAAQVLHALYERGLQLALVNACKSSAQAAAPAFGGIAPALIRAKVPAVVGMLTSIDDAAAGVFVRTFYKTLRAALEGRNLPGQMAARVLLQALCASRRQMIGETGVPRAHRCWWIPVLSLRYDTGEQI